MVRKILHGLLLSACLLGQAWSQALSPEVKSFVKVDAPVVALVHVRVIDGTGSAARDDQTLIVRAGKIVESRVYHG